MGGQTDMWGNNKGPWFYLLTLKGPTLFSYKILVLQIVYRPLHNRKVNDEINTILDKTVKYCSRTHFGPTF